MINIELILAVDNNFGIGYKNNIPWKLKEELNLFREKTNNCSILVGRKTFESLPRLYNREIICISTNTDKDYILNKSNNKSAIVVSSVDEAILSATKKIYIAGGSEIYKLFLEKKIDNIKKIHLSMIRDTYNCDTFFDYKLLRDFYILEHNKYVTFDHYVLERNYNDGEKQYLQLLENILDKGKLCKGRNGDTLSVFVRHMNFDLREGFPLLTTKKMFWKGIVEELLFFLRGDTNTKILENEGINIWKRNTTKEFIKSRGLNYAEGVFGPLYGYQFRHFNAPYEVNLNGEPIKNEGGVDQLLNVIKNIKQEPKSRRIIMTSYNPYQVEEGVLYPCHSIVLQFYVDEEYLDMYCYNRSSDAFLGLPFNIASSSLLLIIIAKITNKIPRYFNLSLGDCHIYSSHIQQVKKQINRIPYKFCFVELPDIKNIDDIHNLSYKNFILNDYKSHSFIKAEMVA